jgi:hypothetical protein
MRLAILVFGVLISTSSLAQIQIIEVRVTAKSLNVRDQANTSGEVIGSLSRGDVTAAYFHSSGWLGIRYKGKHAYISAKYVETVRVFSEGNEEECEPDWGNVTFGYSRDSFKCKEGFASDGYERCEMDINLNATSSCPKDFSVNASCDVSYKVTKPDDAISFDSRRSEYLSASFYAYSGSGSSYEHVSWKPGRFMETIIGVKITGVSCSLNGVYPN